MLSIQNNKVIKYSQVINGRNNDDYDEDDDKLFNNNLSSKNQNGIVNDDNLNDYLVDNIEQDKEDDINNNRNLIYDYEKEPNSFYNDYKDEIPLQNQNLQIPENSQEITYVSPFQLVDDALDSSEIISFEYTNRHGDYSGLRTVEPHYTFIARTTGNEVVVTFDRDVNDIRAFIVGNMHPNGVRYKNVKFTARPEIMKGVI